MKGSDRPRILFVDAYDSFTNNIVALLENQLNAHVSIIHIDTYIDCLELIVEGFDAVVLGPGPGDPQNVDDVGLYQRFWQLKPQHAKPILGICLGFQSMVLAFGGQIHRLPQPRHGIIRTVTADQDRELNLLRGNVKAVQYHSLHAVIPDQQPAPVELVPLAWDHDVDNQDANFDAFTCNPKSVLMAARHRDLPYWGVQFHPESICSDTGAGEIIVRWWHHVLHHSEHSECQGSQPRYPSPQLDISARRSPPNVEASAPTHTDSRCVIHTSLPQSGLTIEGICSKLGLSGTEFVVLDSENHQRPVLGRFSVVGLIEPSSVRFEYRVGTEIVRQLRGPHIAECMLKDGYDGDVFAFLKAFVLQNRANHGNPVLPFWGGLIGCISYEGCLETINIKPRPDLVPNSPANQPPDFSFVFVERSIVISHATKEIYVQSIRAGDQDWVQQTAYILGSTPPPSPIVSPSLFLDACIERPIESEYQSKFGKCLKHIGAGDSYELCLTNPAIIITNRLTDPWPLYMRLRRLNPAPFAAYFNIGGLTLLSSSPERFLCWSRPAPKEGSDDREVLCQFRPIKGTVKRQPDPSRPPLTLAQAEAILSTPKEKAENLMIVDLICHDLHGVAGAGSVTVPKLMVVEEYETVFQLVSVIEGRLTIPSSLANNTTDEVSSAHSNDPNKSEQKSTHPTKTGIDVLAASLPPGSMTGAPKLRSCQILQSLEQKPRGIYSGVFGYLDVGGGGDFSVVIRSAFKWDASPGDSPATAPQAPAEQDSKDLNTAPASTSVSTASTTDTQDLPSRQSAAQATQRGRDTWTIGAGGAITALSTAEGEFAEMLAKLDSTLCLFEGL